MDDSRWDGSADSDSYSRKEMVKMMVDWSKKSTEQLKELVDSYTRSLVPELTDITYMMVIRTIGEINDELNRREVNDGEYQRG